MAGARGRLHNALDAGSTRRSTRRQRQPSADGDVPAVFREMLHDEQASKAISADEDDRPVKKRRTAATSKTADTVSHSPRQKKSVDQSASPPPSLPRSAAWQPQVPGHSRARLSGGQNVHPEITEPSARRIMQTAYDSDESDDSDEEWEDALGDGDDSEDHPENQDNLPQIGDISITIGGNKNEPKSVKRQIRRRAITAVDKKKRLNIHKMHILCLLYHVYRRNVWCNDLRTQNILRKLVPSSTLQMLVPNPDLTQYSASKRFIEGMNELKILWSKRFKLNAQGMSKPKWAEADADVRPFSDFDNLDDPMDKDEFRNTAHTLRGSQDVGVQLFCTLLRGIGVETRLICSLQPLPFSSSAQPATPQKTGPSKNTIVIDPYNNQNSVSPSRSKAEASSRPKKLSRLERIMGERHAILNKTGVAQQKQKAYHTPYPVYWVEVFNTAHQKWVAIDTHSTFTVNAPEKLEPPLNSTQNSLTYAIAFDEDYTAKDVTRRYAKAYNAKTRKFRVECTPHGAEWWRRTMKFFQRARSIDRDQIEDAALARKEAAEGMPKNVQDFKDHPVYVLERHLKHNEVIHPLNQVGKVNVSSAMNPKMELIYRRKDVHVVRSADKWYRMGYDVKDGEQPLKHAKPKKGRRLSIGPDMEVDEQQDEVGAALYADFQTELYVPPPVVRGRVPRNVYGNLDLYVPSMCPPGGTHVRHKLASKAARLVGVDYADAVTGFSFKGRHGTAIIQGVVVASEYAEAVQATIDGMEYEQEAAANAARSRESLRLWRRFFLGLRIAQRVNAIEIDGEKGPSFDVQGEIDREDKAMEEKEMAGGFFPDEADFAEPTRRAYSPPPQEYGGGGFMVDDENENEVHAGGFMPNEENEGADRGPKMLTHEHSFESSILDSQQLRPRRRSSFAEDFIVEEEKDDDDDDSPSPPPADSSHIPHQEGGSLQDDSEAAQAGGFIPEDRPTRTPEHGKDEMEVDPPGSKSQLEQLDAGLASAPDASTPVSVISDTGSLLMEDPEDEDADPDWLVDAT